ncbi:uncharacterized protein K02A2.6-like [Pseudophryne corroboree]|uniref:uncharacterized protein K02A2.6-like n=1 Tax=Pseudophryne corroboree TaxID=495146 RepID=UPI003081D9D4
MKNLARSYVWWPGIDGQIEILTKGCEGCQRVQNAPPLAPLHPWEWPSSPWQRVHIDFAGPFMDCTFLIAVDAHSKWPEVIKMKSTTSEKTIAVLRTIFARNGLPEQVCSDNGPQFVSMEFKKFMQDNGIKHFTSAPHHPATNGLAERFVQTFKKAIKSMHHEHLPLQHKIDNFLFIYRRTEHSTTGQPPAVLFMQRNLRSQWDLIKLDVRRKVHNKQFQSVYQKPTRFFHIGQEVLVRDYRGDKWQPGIVSSKAGPLMYEIEVGGELWHHHIDQIIEAGRQTDCTSTAGHSQASDVGVYVYPSGTDTETVPDTVEEMYPSGSDTETVSKPAMESPEHEVPLVTTDPEPSSGISVEQPVTLGVKHRYPDSVRKAPQRHTCLPSRNGREAPENRVTLLAPRKGGQASRFPPRPPAAENKRAAGGVR